jgi:hypothetical protein
VRKADLERWRKFFEARDMGLGIEAAARKARIPPATAYRFAHGDQGSAGREAAEILGIDMVAGEYVLPPLKKEALAALDDFAVFRMRYFGRRSTPWQLEVVDEYVQRLESPEREFMVVNVAPGSGKSTLLTHDMVCWLIARNRAIRIMIGARTERQARQQVGRIKKSLERDVPMRVDPDKVLAGIAFNAEATMQDDFGAFKPEGRSDKWRAEALVVRQLDGVALDDKEDTVAAFGQDSGFLGGRFDLVIWDDLVDKKNQRTQESREAMHEWWDAESETRVEPGGCLVLNGQRIQHNDLYNYCLSKKTLDNAQMYSHLVYRAHDTEKCQGYHLDPDTTKKKKDRVLPPWPDSCLLDPWRLPWEELEAKRVNNPRTYAVQYQQEDGAIEGGLLDPAWIYGGMDADSFNAPGCLDEARSIGEIPAHLKHGNGWSFVTVDPSPTEWWGVIDWIYDPNSQRRYVVDIIRRRMNPEQFLTRDVKTGVYSGLLTQIMADSIARGAKLSHVVFEVNAAQRWFLSQPIVQDWAAMSGVVMVPHTTTINKQDPKFGLESIGDLFRQGQIRLPWADILSRQRTKFLIDEGVNYPEYDTDDLMMSTWFGKLAVENHYSPARQGQVTFSRPGWVSRHGTQRGLVPAGW